MFLFEKNTLNVVLTNPFSSRQSDHTVPLAADDATIRSVGPSAGRQLIQHQIMSEQAAVMSPARPLPVRLQQDMKDEEMADADGHKPTAGTMGAMAISGTGPTETLVICDVRGNSPRWPVPGRYYRQQTSSR